MPTLCVLMSLDVHCFELPPIGTNCYALIDSSSQAIAVFDAPLNAYATVERLAVERGYKLEGLYFTHGHWDHILDGARFNEAGIQSFAHGEDRQFYEDPQLMSSFAIPGLPMPPVEIGTWVEHLQTMKILGRLVEVRHVPGHSPGSILYWFKDDSFAITGDALFQGSVGRTDFPGCSFEQLAKSIKEQIYTLPDKTKLYPGHGPATSVGSEAAGNPFVTR